MTRAILYTQRFTLKPWENRLDENAHLKEMMQNSEVMRYIKGYALSDDEVKAALEKMLTHNDIGGLGYWLIYDGDICVGLTLLKRCPTQDENLNYNETGYWLKPAYWGQGIAAEVATKMVQYGFDILKLPIIVGVVDAANIASQKSLEKAGLKRNGTIIAYDLELPFYKIDNPNG